MIIKCISRVSTSYSVDCRPAHVKDYFLKINEYVSLTGLKEQIEDFNPPNEKLKPEENLLKAIKGTLEGICNLYKNGIWGHYDKAMSEAKYPDNHIASFISSQGIPYPEKNKVTSVAPSNHNEEMKKIN